MDKILLAGIALVVLGGGFLVFNQEKAPVPENFERPIEETASSTMTDENQVNDSDPVNEVRVTNNNTVLNLSNQNLTTLPQNTFFNAAIQELNLANNSLSGSLPGEIRFLQNLKVLNLSNNQFTGVPAEIGQLRNLEVLDLSNNKITGLPNELGNLSNLKLLTLTGNEYSAADLAGIKNKLPVSVVIKVD